MANFQRERGTSELKTTVPLSERGQVYVSQGWSLLPLLPRAKEPHRELLRDLYGDSRITHLRDAPALGVEVEWWFANWQDINVGVFPGGSTGLAICDIDDLNLLDLDLPTPSASSGRESGGKHHYFRADDPVAMTKTAWGHINPPYVVAPGSTHPTGRIYEWLPGRSPDEVGLLDFDEVRDLVMEQ